MAFHTKIIYSEVNIMHKLQKLICVIISLTLIYSSMIGGSFEASATNTCAYINAIEVNIREVASIQSASLCKISNVYVFVNS